MSGLGGLDGPSEGGNDVFGLHYPFRVCAQTLGHQTEIAAELGKGRRSRIRTVHSHEAATGAPVVKNDCQGGETHSDGSLYLHAHHSI